MSAKWIRSKAWDDEHFPAWAWPAKAVLRAFSSIPLAICWLTLIVVFAILASVPIGLLALLPTYLIYGLSLVVAAGVAGIVPMLVLRRVWRGRTAARFVASVAVLIVGAGVGVEAWRELAWPALHYDAAHHTGFRLFAGFVERYQAITLRRLPGFEMTELEFYAWWPMRLVLFLFVLNMVTATVRRIEFVFPNLGVLTVHTGIVTIALGSMYYQGLKLEGDTVLFAGEPGPDGNPTAGRPQDGFFDNTSVVLWARQDGRQWQQRLMSTPRYNDYSLLAPAMKAEDSALETIRRGNGPDARRVNRALPHPSGSTLIDADISMRLVGYATYANLVADWVRAPVPTSGPASPVRFAELRSHRNERGELTEKPLRAPFYFVPTSPAQRLGETEAFGLEYTLGMSEERWADLAAELPSSARHALVVQMPGGARQVVNAMPGVKTAIGQTGFSIEVKDIAPEPPFPIITEGFRGATSSVAIVRITPPAGAAYDRWVYHRFPEINQDLLDELNERGMPRRRDADPAIRVAYVDASKLQVYVDERGGATRALVRLPGEKARAVEVGSDGIIRDLMPGLDLALTQRWEHAEQVERPLSVTEEQRDIREVGTHLSAFAGIEVRAGDFKRTVWVPFNKYLGADPSLERAVELPGNRRLTLSFGRLRHQFPGFMLQLVDFQMVAYDHRGSPRDFQSRVRVVARHEETAPSDFKTYEHITKLNAPLQAPFMPMPERSLLQNTLGTLSSRLDPRQFKLSQAGWDARGWETTQKQADQGALPRAYASFTILGVGNNPGIHIIALGGILMSVGIPWAFYVKPLILRRRKQALQRELARSARGNERPSAVGAEV
ncbi:MAG: hypothetical protein ACKVW3_17630 [Phycisphaerales bacterium]